MSAAHTPGPWKVSETHGIFSTTDAHSSFIADCRVGHSDRRAANAAFIVEACNNYDALRSISEDLIWRLRNALVFVPTTGVAERERIEATIADAEKTIAALSGRASGDQA